ncbi:MAG: FliG C-terminal domain-containing protein [Chloroflexota bacterium]
MSRQNRASTLAAWEALGTTADPGWINTVMRACYTDDVIRALVMVPPAFREHLFTGVSDRGRELAMDGLAMTLMLGIAPADIEAARITIGTTALRLSREAASHRGAEA